MLESCRCFEFFNSLNKIGIKVKFLFSLIPLREPRMLADFRNFNSSIDINIKHFSDELFGIIRDVLPRIIVEFYFSFHNVLKNLSVIFSIKRWVSTEHYVKNYSKTPYVTFKIIISFKYFGSYVVRSSHNCFHVRDMIRFTKFLRQSKIYDFNFRVFLLILKKEILWL
jgi:hypothetical protein